MLDHAHRKGHISQVHIFFPLKGFKKGGQHEQAPLSFDEENNLIENAASTMHAALFAYALDTGVRPGEAVSLHWEDITWGASEGADWGKVYVRGTKTRESLATLPLGPRSSSRLADLHRDNGHPESGPVFVWHGKSIKSFRRALTRSAARAGIERAVNRYLLRHTMATRLTSRGLAVEDVARVMRHTNPRMVQERYDHSDVSARVGARKIFGDPSDE